MLKQCLTIYNGKEKYFIFNQDKIDKTHVYVRGYYENIGNFIVCAPGPVLVWLF